MTEPWPEELNVMTTVADLQGPQPGDSMCCDSCRIVARAVARLAANLGYYKTAAELFTMLQEEAS